MIKILNRSKLAFSKVKSRLENLRRSTEHQIEEIKQEDPFSNEERVVDNADIGMEAGDQINHDRAEFLKKDLEITLVLVKKALSKIGLGKYGYCENCGQAIDKARLEVYPLADLCLECQKKKK